MQLKKVASKKSRSILFSTLSLLINHKEDTERFLLNPLDIPKPFNLSFVKCQKKMETVRFDLPPHEQQITARRRCILGHMGAHFLWAACWGNVGMFPKYCLCAGGGKI